MVVLWRAVDLRLIIPLIPLWVLYAATALDAAREWAGGRAIAKGAMILTLLQVGLAYGSTYAHAQYGVIRAGIADPNFVELCLYIEQGTPRNAVFIFSLPRMLAFMTNRSASVYYRPKDDSELWDYFRTISATYVISPVETQYDRGYFTGFIARSRNQLRPVYENSGFVMYQIVPSN